MLYLIPFLIFLFGFCLLRCGFFSNRFNRVIFNKFSRSGLGDKPGLVLHRVFYLEAFEGLRRGPNGFDSDRLQNAQADRARAFLCQNRYS